MTEKSAVVVSSNTSQQDTASQVVDSKHSTIIRLTCLLNSILEMGRSVEVMWMLLSEAFSALPSVTQLSQAGTSYCSTSKSHPDTVKCGICFIFSERQHIRIFSK